MPRILEEGYRVLRHGGLMLHLEQPPYKDTMPVYEQFIRDWDSYNNNEPFWSTIHSFDLPEMMKSAGFTESEVFEDHVKASVDRSIFTATADEGKTEDHGRAAAWYALGAWKKQPELADAN
jgi:ubiquinone/menaquinone biosynthesis C-methylase UbiE